MPADLHWEVLARRARAVQARAQAHEVVRLHGEQARERQLRGVRIHGPSAQVQPVGQVALVAAADRRLLLQQHHVVRRMEAGPVEHQLKLNANLKSTERVSDNQTFRLLQSYTLCNTPADS